MATRPLGVDVFAGKALELAGVSLMAGGWSGMTMRSAKADGSGSAGGRMRRGLEVVPSSQRGSSGSL